MDLAGNTRAASDSPDSDYHTLVSADPSELRLSAATDSGVSSTDNVMNDRTPTVTDMAEAGATVTLYREQQLLGSAIADANGTGV
ncbi:Ig-like domain-containing protein [Leptothermofonsia sp. ETS-13]|uniref:Ig-like domain-containing protein n=1 Tax=Leptothermofonsia sp. ETS-13 TaxID=3035696 RepID=UPI003BA0321B